MPKVIARHRLDRVRLVENHDVVIGQDARPLAPQRDVAEQQRMIHHQNLRMLHPPAILIVKALLIRRAAPAHAVAAVARRLVPNLPQRLKAQIAQRAVVRLFAPLANRPQLIELLVIAEQAAAPRERRIEPPQTQIVPPPLHQHRRKLARDHRIQAAADPSRSAALAN